MLKKFALACLWLSLVQACFCGAAAAQQNASNSALKQYRRQALTQRFSFWTGLELRRNGEVLDPGFFGNDYDVVFADSPAALEAADTFRTMRITGTAIYVLGLAALTWDVVLLLNKNELVVDQSGAKNELTSFHWALFGSGTVFAIGGGFALQGSNVYLAEAVDRYNEDLFERLRKGEARARGGRKLVLTAKHTF